MKSGRGGPEREAMKPAATGGFEAAIKISRTTGFSYSHYSDRTAILYL